MIPLRAEEVADVVRQRGRSRKQSEGVLIGVPSPVAEPAYRGREGVLPRSLGRQPVHHVGGHAGIVEGRVAHRVANRRIKQLALHEAHPVGDGKERRALGDLPSSHWKRGMELTVEGTVASAHERGERVVLLLRGRYVSCG